MSTLVKDLARLYESSPGGSPSTNSEAPSTSVDTLVNDAGHTRARFLNHTRRNDGHNSYKITQRTARPSSPLTPDSKVVEFKDLSSSKSALHTTLLSDDVPSTTDISWSRIRFARSAKLDSVNKEDKEILLTHTYPPHSHASLSGAHVPIPATILFARKAAPLHLPHLDDYLANLPKAPFLLTTNQPGTKVAMFKPLDQLEKLGKSLDDLESNGTATPFWRNRKTLLGSAINALIGILGSSVLAPFYSLQGVINTVQIFALLLSTIIPASGRNLEDRWRKVFLGTIPNVLALNFASVLTQSLLFLILFMIIAAGLLVYFYRATIRCDRYNTIEGLQQTEAEGSRWGLVIVTFILTVIYLPMSTMAVHVLVWSQDLWAVPNPYHNTTFDLSNLPPLGPANKYRDPLDFCWTTTMKRNEINYSPVIIILSIAIISSLTIWYPIALRRVIKQSVPKVDGYTELGRPRRSWDLDSEYQRLLSRDKNPFAFLYSAFRRGWGTYESTYLFAKLSTLVIIAVIDSDNCLFRKHSSTIISLIRQILLLVSTIAFFAAQCIFAPFLDPVNNASEWTSRLNYVTTSTTALLIVLNVPGKDIIDTYVLYSIYIITYGLSFYFSAINTGILQRLVKRITRRIDFSIDIFSPRLDTSVHLKRRIWQETISTLIFTSADTCIPKSQPMAYVQARDSDYPPYLLNFVGSPGERHAENIKILREVGTSVYTKAVALLTGPDNKWYRHLENEIQRHHTGPDSYWKYPEENSLNKCTNFFGNAWWIPFPPTLVIRYDDDRVAVLQDASDFATYVAQNTDPDVQKRRHIRVCLRALENQQVIWPYNHVMPVGQQSFSFCRRRHYSAHISKYFRYCILRIKRKGKLCWQGLPIGSGFELELEYDKGVKVSGEVIGLTEDFELTPPLARFLQMNQDQIHLRSQAIEEKIFNYRSFHHKECRWKEHVLSHRFHIHVYNQPRRDPNDLLQSSITFEQDPRVRKLMQDNDAVFEQAYSRYQNVAQNEVTAWWYIFWDDFWRRNHDTISPLSTYATDFNPYYPSSIAYSPISRPALESFLAQRGLFNGVAKRNDWFHHGLLNKIYLRLNESAFVNTSGKSIMFHLGHGAEEMNMTEVDIATHAGSSALGTGGGTDHDISWIRTRPAYQWEGVLSDPMRKDGQKKWLSKLGTWFGLTPVWRGSDSTNGLAVDVALDDRGRYVLLGNESESQRGNKFIP